MVREVLLTVLGAGLILALFRIWYPIEVWTAAITVVVAGVFAAIRHYLARR